MKHRGRKSILTFGAAALSLAFASGDDARAQAENANCRAEIAVHCARIAPGEGRVAQCLKESFWQLSPACQAYTETVASMGKETLQSCQDDMLLHCSRAEITSRRGTDCLAKKKGLSPTCSVLAELLRKGGS